MDILILFYLFSLSLSLFSILRSQSNAEVYFRFEAGDHGGISDNGFDNGKRWQSSSQRRYTVPLLEILKDRARAPIDIDYLSLDVEGTYVCVFTLWRDCLK